MDSVPHWFPGVKLNFAENILFSRDATGNTMSLAGKEDEKIACSEIREDYVREPIRHITWRELRHRTGCVEQAMKKLGVRKGDRIAGVSAVSLDTLTIFLATTALGGIFTSSSTDMGTKGILDRLLQTKPKFLFMDDAAWYNGRTTDLRPKMAEIVNGMSQVGEFMGVISMVRWTKAPADISRVPRARSWSQFLSSAQSTQLEFERLDFCDPLIIVYSSGTTGQPKCIVHGVGGVILNGYKEDCLHREIDCDSRQLQYTTTGWIMYLGAVQALLTGCRMLMFDGSPLVPDSKQLLHLVGQEHVTHLSISPRYLQTLKNEHIIPRHETDLSQLKVLTSTGMVLSEALFEWVYDVAFPAHVQLDNIAGGTDLAGCFGCSNAISPLYVGGCQGLSLGMAVSVYDSTIEGGGQAQGQSVPDGIAGELVCTKAFPTMPIMFWGANGKQKYFDSYFEKYDGCWTHGDFVSFCPNTGRILFHGRADGVLNPSGVRFGSAEIYAIIESTFADTISDSICVGQRRPHDVDESVILFLLMQSGQRFTAKVREKVRDVIKGQLGPRYVPRYIFETPEIPKTINNKKVELPVKQIVSGKIIKPSSTLANPKCLDYYYRFAKDDFLVGQAMSRL